MTKRTLRASDGEGFLRALWDDWRDTEATYAVEAMLSLTLSDRKGVIRMRLSVYRKPVDVPEGPIASYSAEYPTSAVQSFEAALYQCMVKLERVLESRAAFPMGKA